MSKERCTGSNSLTFSVDGFALLGPLGFEVGCDSVCQRTDLQQDKIIPLQLESTPLATEKQTPVQGFFCHAAYFHGAQRCGFLVLQAARAIGLAIRAEHVE